MTPEKALKRTETERITLSHLVCAHCGAVVHCKNCNVMMVIKHDS